MMPNNDPMDRALWLAVRRALQMICSAIEKRYALDQREPPPAA